MTILKAGVCALAVFTFSLSGASAEARDNLFQNTPLMNALDPSSEQAVSEKTKKEAVAVAEKYVPSPESEPAIKDTMIVAGMDDDLSDRRAAGIYLGRDQIGEVLSLRDAVATGVWTNPEYGAVANNRRATDAELRQARGLYLPSVDLRADTGYEYTDDVSTRAGAGDDTESLYRYESGLTLTQLLFDGHDSFYENRRQEARVESASHRVREVTEFVGLDVVQAYLDVYRQRELEDIAQQNVAEHVRILDQITDSSDAGRTTQADVEQARSRLANARATAAITEQDLKFAEANFIREVGRKPPALGTPLVPYDSLLMNVEEEVTHALVKSPTLDIFETDIDVADAEYKGAKSSYYPQLDMQLNARNGEDLGGVEGRDTSASALVVMNWNLYRGGIDTARVKELVQRKATVKEQRADAARGIENDVRQTWARMMAARTRATQFDAQIDASQEVVDAYKDQFDLNRRTLLDVLDAQNELFVSQSNKLNAQFLEMFAVYRILALRGSLLPTLNIPYPGEAKADNL